MSVRDGVPRCECCGRFIGYHSDTAVFHYIPDSAYSYESIEWTCGKCLEKHETETVSN